MDILRSQQELADLQASEARFQKLANNLPGMITQFRTTVDGSPSTLYVSSGCIDICEVSVEDFLSGVIQFEDLQHPDDRPRIQQAGIYASEKLMLFKEEFRIITPSGNLKWVQVTSQPERQADGSTIWDSIILDITDRKQAEQELQQSQQFLRLLLDNIPQLVFWKDRESNFMGCNTNGARLVGLESPDMIVGQTDYTLPFTVESAAQNVERDRRVMESGQSDLHTMIHQRSDGSTRWLDTRKTPLRDLDGNVIGVLVTLEDISDRKLAEIEVQKLASVVENTTDFIGIANIDDGQALYLNAGGRKLMGLGSIDSVENMHISDFHSREDMAKIQETLIPHLRQHGYASAELHLQHLITQVQIPVEWNIFTIKDPNTGQPSYIAAIIRDISDRKRAEAELNQRTAELEQTLKELKNTQTKMVQSEKMSGLGQLVAGVAHEINNPVNFIYGNLIHAHNYAKDLGQLLELYQKHYPDPHAEIQEQIEEIELNFLLEDMHNLLASMQVGAERIQKIVVSLRTFSRMDEADMKSVNIHDGIDSTLMILQHRLKARSDASIIEIIKAYGELPLVECYAGQLNQVFMNLLSNAIDALEESLEIGQIHSPRITISTALVNAKEVMIQISDNGIGIPTEIQHRLFDPFFTTKPVGKGTGMGLSISYQIVVDKHGGKLECVSGVEQGSTFIVTIPIHQH